MRTFIAKLNARGQATIPREIREMLNLSLADRVSFLIDKDGKVVLRRTRSIADLAGAVPALAGRENEDLEVIISEAREELAERIVRALEEM